MNRPIRVMAIGCLVLFVALMININYVQYIDADELNARSGNDRVQHDEFSRDRGPILVDGEPVAESVAVDDEFDYLRRYNRTNLYANLTGFYSYIYGQSGLEADQNGILSGSDPRLFVNRVIDLLSSEPSEGGSVELTILPEAQRAAYEGLQAIDSEGAVVALDPSTGAILSMVSLPGWDPNPLASHDFDKAAEAYQKLLKDPENPMSDRSREEIYQPGSTFKLVTAAAALQNGYTPDTLVNGNNSLSFPGIEPLTNEVDCGGGQITFEAALANSCNVAFAEVGMDLGEDKLRAQAEAFGFGDISYLDELRVAPSQLTSAGRPALESRQLADTSIGQFDVAASPLQMAMVTAAIANDGTVMDPYIVNEVRSPELDVLERTTPDDYSEAMSDAAAEQLTQMMETVRTSGTASTVPDLPEGTAAKTGTAQRNENLNPYAWFVAFAPANDPEVAVAVFVQDASGVSREDIHGGALAGPIAADVMNAVLNQ